MFYTQLNQTQREQENQALSNFSFTQSQHHFQSDHTNTPHRLSIEAAVEANSENISVRKSPPTSDNIAEETETEPIVDRSNHLESPKKGILSTQNIFENSPTDVSMNSRDERDYDNAYIVDDTRMSSSSSSAGIEYINENYDDELHDKSSSSSNQDVDDEDENLLDKNLDFIDETVNFDETRMNTSGVTRKSVYSRITKSKSPMLEDTLSSDVQVIEKDVVPKKDDYSRKRKSVDIIQLDDDEEEEGVDNEDKDIQVANKSSKQTGDSFETRNKEDYFKKFKKSEGVSFICLDDVEKDKETVSSAPKSKINFYDDDDSELGI